MLDRVARFDMALEDAAQLSLVSLDATTRSNLSVGPPYEVAIYRRDSFILGKRFLFAGDDPFLDELSTSWNRQLCEAFRQLPRYPWQ
jgi:putative proteasome-type protease